MAQRLKEQPRHVHQRQPLLCWNWRQWRRQVLAAVLGAVFARAALAPGMLPFGVAYLAVAGHPLAAAAGAFLSYLPQGTGGLVYGAAVMVVLACRMILEGTALSRRRGFFAACAVVTLLMTKGVITVGAGGRAAALLLCEGALCAGFALMLGEARDRRSPLALWGRLTAAMGGILALLPLQLWELFSLGRLTAAFLALCAGAFGGGSMGAAVGLAFGACMDLALGRGPFLALRLCAAGLCAGMGKGRLRLCSVLPGCAAWGIMALWTLDRPDAALGMAECFFAAAVLVLLPQRWLLPLENAFADGSPVSLRMSHTAGRLSFSGLSEAVSALGTTMGSLLARSTAQEETDLGRVYRTACENACRSCKKRDICWQEGFQDVQRVLSDLAQPLRANHAIEPETLPAWFSARCLRPQRFCGAINDAYRSALRRQAQLRQAGQVRDLMEQQYVSLGVLLEGMASRSGGGTEYDAGLENRARRVVRAYLPGAKVTCLLVGGRMQIDIVTGPENGVADHGAMVRSLQSALGIQLLPPVPVQSSNGVLLRIRQQEAFIMQTFTAVRKKAGEQVCGDSHLVLHTDDGRGLLLLSDGMGTGQRAGEMSRRALELLAGFVRWGCPLAGSTAAVLPVLCARFEEWGFVTLDLWEISLFDGQADLLKYGAAPGFLLREGRLTRLEARALPAGLEPPDREVPVHHLRLRAGDRLVLLSDGAWEGERTETLLRDSAGMEGQTLADKLLEAAARQGAGDDMTVIVADLSEA